MDIGGKIPIILRQRSAVFGIAIAALIVILLVPFIAYVTPTADIVFAVPTLEDPNLQPGSIFQLVWPS